MTEAFEGLETVAADATGVVDTALVTARFSTLLALLKRASSVWAMRRSALSQKRLTLFITFSLFLCKIFHPAVNPNLESGLHVSGKVLLFVTTTTLLRNVHLNIALSSVTTRVRKRLPGFQYSSTFKGTLLSVDTTFANGSGTQLGLDE